MTARGDEETTAPRVTRRAFTDAASLAGLMAVLGLAGPARGQSLRQLGPAGMQPAATDVGRIFFSDAEAAFIEAAVSRLIPAEGDGPGAIEAGVPNFLDKQLGGEFGGGARLFMGAPFDPAAIPQLGYQLPYTPADMFRRAIGAINRKLAESPFDKMDPDAQDTFLREQLEDGKIGELDGVPAKVFFDQLRELTVQGYFSDPVYGGNKDMVAWKAIGFPGAYAAFRDTVGRHGEAFAIGPYSLADHDKIPEPDMADMEKQR